MFLCVDHNCCLLFGVGCLACVGICHCYGSLVMVVVCCCLLLFVVVCCMLFAARTCSLFIVRCGCSGSLWLFGVY